MLNSNENNIAMNMLNEFEKQLTSIYQDYKDKKCSLDECIGQINWFRIAWNTSRTDIKNNGQNNRVSDFIFEKGITVTFPQWFKDENGQGALLQNNNSESVITFKCINEGELKLIFRGVDYKDIRNNRLPVYFNYTSIKLDETELLKENKVLWHNEVFSHNLFCQNNQTFTLKLKIKGIYSYYPLLSFYLSNIKEKNGLDKYYNIIINYIKNEKEFYNSNKLIAQENSELNEALKLNLALLNKRNNELNVHFEEYKQKTNKILDSYNFLFNNLFKFNDVQPKKLVKLSRTLNIQMLDFIDNVCKKHNLQWWLYAGTLLGAIRHNGFIPWDDDCDINMMREDYEKFYEVIHQEIKNHNLSEFMEANTSTVTNNNVYLPFIKLNYWINNNLYGFIDIFPSDYLKNEIPQIESVFRIENSRVSERLRNGEDRKQVIADSSSVIHVSKTKTNKIISGVEDSIFAIHDYDTIFPLTKLKFEDREYPCPKHYHTYISKVYGNDYMQIPKLIYAHGFYDYISFHKDVYNNMEKHIEKLKQINKNF